MHLKQKPVVLISALDWGMGHATRCIPIIEELIAQNAEVILMGSERVLERWKMVFPDLERIQSNDHSIEYSSGKGNFIKILRQVPLIKKKEQETYIQLLALCKKRKIDLIISDNRYYFYHERVYSVIISHQLSPKLPSFLNLISAPFKMYMASLHRHFNEIWIADAPLSSSIAGDLSKNRFVDRPSFHLGVLSRFKRPIERSKRNKHVLIASGPQPQQGILIDEFVRIYSGSVTELTIITSLSYNLCEKSLENIVILSNPNDEEFVNTLKTSSLIITRSGYSSIMDLFRLNTPALLIPTPGQTEQEYLADYMSSFGFSGMTQAEIQATSSPEGLIKPEPKLKSIEAPFFILYKQQLKRVIDKISRSELHEQVES